MSVTVIVPAHNEEACIADALWALHEQTRQPDRVIVVLDNCTDNTASRVEPFVQDWIAETWKTQGNAEKKAGALNAALTKVLPTLSDDDFVLVQDADSFLDRGFIAAAVEALEADSRLGAVGGTFRGRGERGSLVTRYLSMCQRAEFVRYQRDTARLKGKALTLTGTAAMFRVRALRDLAASRESQEVYTTTNLTEDLESCVRLMWLGWKIRAPKDLTLTTEVMPTWRELYKQRIRWREGAVRTMAEYGFVRGCRELYARLIYSFVGIWILAIYLGTLAYFIGSGTFQLLPFWIGVTGVFAAEQAITVWRGGWWRALVGAALVIELPYQVFLQTTNLVAYFRAIVTEKGAW